MVVDGFPQEQLAKYYDLYGDRGLKLFLDKGGWYGNNHYSHATTYTSVGHATLLSCAHPASFVNESRASVVRWTPGEVTSSLLRSWRSKSPT